MAGCPVPFDSGGQFCIFRIYGTYRTPLSNGTEPRNRIPNGRGLPSPTVRAEPLYPPVRRFIIASASGLAPERTATLTSAGRPELMARSTAGATSAGFSTYSA